MVRIAVLDDYQDVARHLASWDALPSGTKAEFFHDTLKDPTALIERLQPYQVLVTMRERTRLPASVLQSLPNLRLIAGTGRGQAHVELEAATRLGIMVCGTDGSGSSTVELTWGLILAITRHIPQENAAMRRGEWQTSLGVGLQGKTLALLGLGRIGSGVAAVAPAFGMEVIAWTPNLTQERAARFGATHVEQAKVFSDADILSIHAPLNDSTRGLVGPEELGVMRPSAYLVNTSRGPVVDEKALVQALSQRRIAGAALDVYDDEPLPAGHPLTQLDNVVLTPHLGYVTSENLRTMYAQCVENIRNFLAGKPSRVVNPEVLTSSRASQDFGAITPLTHPKKQTDRR